MDPSVGQQISGTLLFSDQDAGATHSISVTGVSVNGDTGAINDIPDVLALFSLGTLDQAANSIDWTFDHKLNAILDLGLGEAVVFDYDVELTDDRGQTDT